MENLQNTDNNFWMERAKEVANESSCIREKTRWGAVAVKDGVLIASGYNAPPKGICPCSTRGYCIRQKNNIPSGTQREVAYCICAEQRLICNAAREGVNLDGADVYVTGISCTVCIRLMIECGIKRVFQLERGEYHNALSEEIAREAGLEMIFM